MEKRNHLLRSDQEVAKETKKCTPHLQANTVQDWTTAEGFLDLALGEEVAIDANSGAMGHHLGGVATTKTALQAGWNNIRHLIAILNRRYFDICD